MSFKAPLKGSLVLAFLLLLGIAAQAAQLDPRFPFSGPRLTYYDFEKITVRGTWFVKHYSPTCPHCQDLAPIWEQIGKELKYLESKEFFFAQVDCIAERDLCDDHDVHRFPTLILYHKGERAEDYSRKATYEKIKAWILERVDKYAPVATTTTTTAVAAAIVTPVTTSISVVPTSSEKAVVTSVTADSATTSSKGKLRNKPTTSKDLPSTEAVAVVPSTPVTDAALATKHEELEASIKKIAQQIPQGAEPAWNLEGKNVDLDSLNFDTLTAKGPWFIKFYAPWCGHCKALAPIWLTVSKELKGLINVGQVDCTVEVAICQRFEVQGYPTIKMLVEQFSTEYHAPRTVEAMKAFAIRAAGDPVHVIDLDEIDDLRKKHEVFYVLVEASSDSDIARLYETVAKAMFSHAVYFQVLDVAAIRAKFGLTKTPAILCFKDDTNLVYDGAFTAVEGLRDWIQHTKYPALIELDDHNARDILLEDKMVVLALVDPNTNAFNKEAMRTTAKRFKEKLLISGKEREVVFAWIDAIKWGTYVEKAYGTSKTDLPKIVVVDALESEYYDTDLEGQHLSYTSESLSGLFHAIQHGELQGKSTLGAVAGWIKSGAKHVMRAGNTARNYPFMTIMVLVSVIGMMVYVVKRSGGAYQPVNSKVE